MDAVARSRQRDAGLSALLERRQSHHSAGPSHSDDDEVRPVATPSFPKHPAAMLPQEKAGQGNVCLHCHSGRTEQLWKSCLEAHRMGLA